LQGKTIIDRVLLFTFNSAMENSEPCQTAFSGPPGLDWERVINALPDGLIVTDREYNIVFANPAACRIAAKTAARIVGAKCHQVFGCALCHTPSCPLTRLREQGEPLHYETNSHCKVHQTPWMVTASAYYDADSEFAGMVEKITDGSTLLLMRNQLYHSRERLRKNMGAIIQAMSTTIEKRDPYTAGHQRRVAKLCRAIATQMGFSWEAVQGLRMAAAIHDLGKIHVPAGILNKPGPMSEHEIAIIRMHPRTAHDILKGIQFPWPLAETIYQHHERLDGSGYPRQLKGDEILLEARILAVADVVESMVSFRPYRPEMDLNEAIEELRSHRGTLYDARVVDICIALITEKGFDFKTKRWQRPKRQSP
jgi:HD-GYP domain-containing protein (c-di-GMP phosphodiesterase class II)